MKDLSWKDAPLLREMERFEARDQKATGPRAPLSEDIPQALTVDVLLATNNALRWDVQNQKDLKQDALVRLQTERYRSVRNHKLFVFAAVTAGAWFLVAVGLALKIAGMF